MKKKQTEKCYPVVHNDKHKLFTFVERVENEVVICVGNQVICDKVFKTVDEANAYVQGINWELLANLMCLIAEKVFEQKQTKKTKKNEKI